MRVYRDYGSGQLTLATNHEYTDPLIDTKIERVLYYLMMDTNTSIFKPEIGANAGFKDTGKTNVLSLSRTTQIQAALLDARVQYVENIGEPISLTLESFEAEGTQVWITITIDDETITVEV